MSDIRNSEHTAEYPRHIMLTVAFTELKEKGMDDIADLLQQMHRSHQAQAKRMAELEAALSGLADFSEQAGYDCQQARALLANKTPEKKAAMPTVTDAQLIAILQKALAFWLPMVQGAEEMAARIANDAWLLCGMDHADVDLPSAEALGWISVNGPRPQHQMDPALADLQSRLKSRVLLAHGGQAYSFEQQWSLTQGDSMLHKEAAAYIDALVAQLATQAQGDSLKLVQIRNMALEEAALIADGMDIPLVAAAIRERILSSIPAETDYAQQEKEHLGDPDKQTGIYGQK